MSSHAPSRTFSISSLRQLKWRAWTILAIVFLACLAYWAGLLESQRTRISFAESQIHLRAKQTSQTLSLQVSTLFHGLEYVVRNVAASYQFGPDAFKQAVESALNSFPTGSIIQIGVVNADGLVVYSSLLASSRLRQAPVSVANREHFQVHLRGTGEHMFISNPVLGRISGEWSILLSYPIRKNGRFLGIVAVAIDPDYISDFFRKVFAGNSDVAMLLGHDGTYLARSLEQERVLDKRVPAEREFLRNPQASEGQYEVVSPIDGIRRYYAWTRLPEFPLVVSIGLDPVSVLEPARQRNRLSLLVSALGTAITMIATIWIALLFARLRYERRRNERWLVQQAMTDVLTGLPNRAAFMARLDAELVQFARGGRGGMLMMLDLDHFKRINDTYGHAAGDAVLVRFGKLLHEFLRSEDFPARWGGEEFIALLPKADEGGATVLAKRLCAMLEKLPIDVGGQNIRITTSIGIASLAGGQAAEIIAQADAALYKAKHSGRNQVVVAWESVPAAAVPVTVQQD